MKFVTSLPLISGRLCGIMRIADVGLVPEPWVCIDTRINPELHGTAQEA